MFYPSLCFSVRFTYLEKIMPGSRCVLLIALPHEKTADANNSGPTIWRFELWRTCF